MLLKNSKSEREVDVVKYFFFCRAIVLLYLKSFYVRLLDGRGKKTGYILGGLIMETDLRFLGNVRYLMSYEVMRVKLMVGKVCPGM